MQSLFYEHLLVIHSANIFKFSLGSGPAVSVGETAINNIDTSLVLKQLTA